jgi:hypothetical protein
MEAYRKIVEQKIRAMSWKTVTDLLMERPRSVSLDEGSHRVILINPDPETRFDCIPTIVAKPVGAMLLEQDSQSRWRNSHHLYQSLRQDPKTRSSSGWAMEAAFHALCTKGVDFKLHPMSIRPGGRTNDLYTNSMASTPLDLSLPVQELVVFEGLTFQAHSKRVITTGLSLQLSHLMTLLSISQLVTMYTRYRSPMGRYTRSKQRASMSCNGIFKSWACLLQQYGLLL